MFSPTDIVNGLTTEIGGFILIGLAAMMWGLRKPEERQKLWTDNTRRLTTLLAVSRGTVLRWQALPFTIALCVAIALSDTRMAGASQAAVAVVLLAYACVGVWYIVRRFR